MRTFSFMVLFFFCVNVAAQDTYHTELLEDLKLNYGIENPAFLITNSEISNINAMGIYGNSTLSVSDVENLSFSKAVNIKVNAAGNNQWDSGYNVRNSSSIAIGDIVLITFWAKSNSQDSELFFFSEDAGDFSKDFYFSMGLTPDWTQYFMAFEAKRTYAVNGMSLGFHLASLIQDFDIAGFTAFNFGSAYELEMFPSSFDSGSYEGSDPDAEWRAEAQERIEELRTSELTITVVNENGDLIEGAEVEIQMEEHLFGFGSAFVACRFPGNDCYNSTYVEKVFDLDGEGHGFNVGVTENAVKWDAWEEEWIGSPEETADAIQFLHENGVTMRGHTLFWPGFQYLPEDIQQNQNDLSYVRNRIAERIETMINHPELKDIIREWDVLNEIAVNRDFENIFENDPNFTTGREIYQEVFEAIRAEDPGLKLYMNDYVVLSGGGSSSSVVNRYKEFLTEIQNSNQPFDGIGFQCHIGSNPTSILKLKRVFDEFYKDYGVPIKITEYDLNELVSDEVAAQYLSDFLTMIFSHPAVDAFIMWGFWDGNHWKGNAPMFYENWDLKPSGQAFIDKVFGEWWTEEEGMTNTNGQFVVDAFKGSHSIIVRKDGVERIARVSLNGDRNVQVLLEGALSVQDELNAAIRISSNPATNGYIELIIDGELNIDSIDVLSSDGKLIQTYTKSPKGGRIDCFDKSGMYLLHIQTNNGLVVKKVIF
ncbi:MAG: endo-1,4-beta-xylanase [Bacteroidota bacterium]